MQFSGNIDNQGLILRCTLIGPDIDRECRTWIKTLKNAGVSSGMTAKDYTWALDKAYYYAHLDNVKGLMIDYSWLTPEEKSIDIEEKMVFIPIYSRCVGKPIEYILDDTRGFIQECEDCTPY